MTRSLVDFSTGEQGSDMISTFRYVQSGQWGKYLWIAPFNAVQKHQYDRSYFLYIYFDWTALFCFLPKQCEMYNFPHLGKSSQSIWSKDWKFLSQSDTFHAGNGIYLFTTTHYEWCKIELLATLFVFIYLWYFSNSFISIPSSNIVISYVIVSGHFVNKLDAKCNKCLVYQV